MKTEDQAWNQLREEGASLLTPGFADRVLKAAREEEPPVVVSHFAMCLATAALCLAAVVFFRVASSGEDASAVAGWNEVAAQATDLDQGL
jgi:hypothetical protein